MGAKLPNWYPLPFSLYLWHGFRSESEDVVGNRVEEHYCFEEGGGNNEDISWIYYDDLNLYSIKTKRCDAIKMAN